MWFDILEQIVVCCCTMELDVWPHWIWFIFHLRAAELDLEYLIATACWKSNAWLLIVFVVQFADAEQNIELNTPTWRYFYANSADGNIYFNHLYQIWWMNWLNKNNNKPSHVEDDYCHEMDFINHPFFFFKNAADCASLNHHVRMGINILSQ